MADDDPDASARSELIGWSSFGEAVSVVRARHNLMRTLSAAIVVGTVLFCINQLDVVMRGDATTVTWIKSASTYLVPFVVANYGVLTATHRRLPSR